MDRVIITGANGAGKSHVAAKLAALRPSDPLISYDALRLTRGWQRRPQVETFAALSQAIAAPRWILEGGPSLLPHALPRATAVVWLDPSWGLRAWRLAVRPICHIGRTRPELPPGNADWPLRQYRFAWRSLRNHAAFERTITTALATRPTCPVWRCRTAQDIAAALSVLT